MQRFSITLLTILCLVSSVSVHADDDNSTKLTIRNESFTGGNPGEVYRDSYYKVTVELMSSERLVSISHWGIGDAEIYLVNHHNQVVDQLSVYEGSVVDYLDIPIQSGNYTIVIWSKDYYGEANFTID